MTDQDQELIAELEMLDAQGEDDPPTAGLNRGLLNGADGALKGKNVQRNSEEGRIILAMGVFERI